jgi:hypothetical protein
VSSRVCLCEAAVIKQVSKDNICTAALVATAGCCGQLAAAKGTAPCLQYHSHLTVAVYLYSRTVALLGLLAAFAWGRSIIGHL